MSRPHDQGAISCLATPRRLQVWALSRLGDQDLEFPWTQLIRTRLFRTQNHFSWIFPSVICYRLFRTPAISKIFFSFPLRIRNSGVQLYCFFRLESCLGPICSLQFHLPQSFRSKTALRKNSSTLQSKSSSIHPSPCFSYWFLMRERIISSKQAETWRVILTYGLLDLTSFTSEWLTTVAVIAVFITEFNTGSAILTGTGITCAHSHDWRYSGLQARIEHVVTLR